MTEYIRTYGIMAMSLLYKLNDMVKCVCYMGIGPNGCFVTGIALMGGHYRIYIISGVAHPRSNSVVLLVLWTVSCNGWGTSIVLQVPRDSAITSPSR